MASSVKKILTSVAANQHDKHQRDAWLRKKSGTKPRGLLLRLDHAACIYASALKSSPAPLLGRGGARFPCQRPLRTGSVDENVPATRLWS
jgi:hypothetical protein